MALHVSVLIEEDDALRESSQTAIIRPSDPPPRWPTFDWISWESVRAALDAALSGASGRIDGGPGCWMERRSGGIVVYFELEWGEPEWGWAG